MVVAEDFDRFFTEGVRTRSDHETAMEEGIHQPAQVIGVGLVGIVFWDQVVLVFHAHAPLLATIRSHQTPVS
jgi:hypothetical protein